MNIRITDYTARSAVFDIEDGGIYQTEKDYELYLNGTFTGKADKVIFPVYGLEPDTFYKVWVVAGVTERKLNKKIMQLERKNQKLSNELAMIKSSKSYRIGRILLFIPRKLKEWIKGSK